MILLFIVILCCVVIVADFIDGILKYIFIATFLLVGLLIIRNIKDIIQTKKEENYINTELIWFSVFELIGGIVVYFLMDFTFN